MFIAIMHQEGGCDYTIGCGTKVVELKAKNKEQATNELIHMFFHEDGDMHGHEEDVGEVNVFEVKEKLHFDLSGLVRDQKEKEKEKEKKRQEEHEKAELRRLKAKYGER